MWFFVGALLIGIVFAVVTRIRHKKPISVGMWLLLVATGWTIAPVLVLCWLCDIEL